MITYTQPAQSFYNGLNGQTRTIVDAAAGGIFLSKTVEEAQLLLEEMACNNYQWPNERSILKKAAGIHEMDSIVSLSAQVLALTNQIAALTTREASSIKEPLIVASTSFVGDSGDTEQVQYINNRNFNYRSNNLSNNLPTYYHPRL